ncbi:prealbumin-like fold domain-containing protein, partial [Ornithinimicrobium tianjinense]
MRSLRPPGHVVSASGRPPRLRAVLLACLLVLVGLAGGTVSQAAVGNPFLIDGTVPNEGMLGNADIEEDDPNGNASELGPLNSSSTKLGVIHTAPVPMLGMTNPNAQTDLDKVWVTSETDDAGDVWLYFAWQRDSNKGSGVLMYEFQAQPVSSACDYPLSSAEAATCNPWANRQPGDFVIVWDQSGNSAVIILRTWYYLDADGQPSTNPDPEEWGGRTLLLDAGKELTTTDDAFAAYSGTRFQGEAAVNLSDTVFPAEPTSCSTIANIIPGTVTGNSDTADYKDTVLGDFVDISNCGSVTITKDTNPEGGTGQFQYTLSRSDDSQIRFDGTLTAQGTLTEDGDGETQSTLVAGAGYTLSENILSGPYTMDSIVCDGVDIDAGGTFEVVANETKQCLITNQLQQGTLNVVKDVTNDDGGTAVPEDYSFTIDGGSPIDFPASGSYSVQVDQGSYDVVEVEADSGGYATTYSDGTNADCVDVFVPAGGSATCTITNDDQPGTLTVTKVITNDNGG